MHYDFIFTQAPNSITQPPIPSVISEIDDRDVMLK